MPSEEEFTHEKRLEYIVRIQMMEQYIEDDREWKDRDSEWKARLEKKVDRVVMQFETSKKIGKALVGVAAAIGAFLAWVFDIGSKLFITGTGK